MKLFYDFHIHTALSPCGDNDMTPNNIVNMALIKELNAIAITDHNTCGNLEAVSKVAQNKGLLIVPGIEVETIEEIHVVCLFPTIENAIYIGEKLKSFLTNIKNREDIFGEQIYYDANDNVIGKCENLLITAASIDIYSLVKIVNDASGIAIPAHIDKSSNSIISNLGFIPSDLNINVLEITKNNDPSSYFIKNAHLFQKTYASIQSSDAHYLEHISEPTHYLEFKYEPTVEDIIHKLKSMRSNHYEQN